MMKNNRNYVVGVDGGGTKTMAALANLEGKILARARTDSAHPRNIGIRKAVENVALAIEKILGKIRGDKKILSTFLGLPAMEEEFKFRKNIIKKEILKHRGIWPIFKGKVIVGSDQLAGFRSGTDEKDGVVLIAGSGSVCHGWKDKKEAITDSCGYLSEVGSAFPVGQKVLRAVFKSLDGRGKKTLLTRLLLQRLRIRDKEGLIRKIYSEKPIETIPYLSIFCDMAAEKGDKTAKNILTEAGRELALSANTVIKRLNFQNKKFPLVLIGSMFNSRVVLDTVKKEIKKVAPKVEFIRPKVEPVMGAVKLALAEVSPHLAPRPGSQDSAIEELNDGKINKITKELKKGKVIVCPTDTVYGLIADATNKKAVEKVFKIKKRPANKPIPVFVKDIKMARKLAKINRNQEKFINSVWSGKVTVILKPKRKFPKGIGKPKKEIGLRIPNYKIINQLLSIINRPLTGTSANISGKPASTKIKEVLKQFKDQKYQPDLVISAGNLPKSKPSLIIDLTKEPPKILRT